MSVEGDASNPVTPNPPVVGSGSGSEGVVGSGGSQGDLVSQLAAMDVRRAHFQGLADSTAAKLARIEGERGMELADMAAKMTALETQIAGIKPASVEDFSAALERHQKLGEYRAALGVQYPGVAIEKLKGSYEELEAQAKVEFEAHKVAEDGMRATLDAKIRAEFAAKYGPLDGNSDAADQGDSGAAGSAPMTVDGLVAADYKVVGDLSDTDFEKYITELETQEVTKG